MRKLEKDSELVLGFLRGIGTTNPLRNSEGFDAVFELGRMRHLLERDYEAVADQAGGKDTYMPELRMVEALVAEQMALLWTPTALRSASAFHEEFRDLIAAPDAIDTEKKEHVKPLEIKEEMTAEEYKAEKKRFLADHAEADRKYKEANEKNQADLDKLSDQEKWILIGVRQCDEAAALFKSIQQSGTASELMQQQALDRWADMYIRGRLLEMAIASPEERLKLQEQVRKMASVHDHKAHKFRNDVQRSRQNNQFNQQKVGGEYIPTEEEIELSGAAFESVVLATERIRLLQKGIYDRTVRLSMPGEDQIEKSIKPLIVHGSLKINLSSDIVIEHISGRKLGGLQAKAMPADVYDSLVQKKAQDTGVTTEYPPATTKMRFTDSPGYK